MPEKTKSTDLLALEESQNVKEDVKGQDEAALNFYIERLKQSRDQRTQPRPELDDMSFEQDYAFNQLSANSYLRRKYNDDDVRVNSGTAEKKIELVLNELLAMNLQPEIRAFDQDDLEVVGLGDDMADVMKRTCEMERDDDLYQDAFLELLTQRAVFVEECYGPMANLTMRTGKSGKFREDKFVQKRLLTSLQVYLGDVTIPAFRFAEQPYIVVYDRMLYSEAEIEYGDMENWKFVRPGAPMTDAYGLQFKYRFGELENQEVEVIRYFSKNEYQVIINGVMMYEPGNKPYWDFGGYPIAMVVLKSMSRFYAYGKPLIASAKFLQGISDETLRNLIRKMRQAIEPPLGVKTGKVYSKDIWSPGAVTQGLPDGAFSQLITHQGVSSSEFQMFQLISSKIDEFVGANSAGNQPGTGSMTATQIIEQQKQSLKLLGLAVMAAMRLKREMSYLRLWSINQYYFEPIGKKFDSTERTLRPRFRSFTINDTDIGNGQTGTKVINFSDKNPSPSELQAAMEGEDAMAVKGRTVRFKTINVEKLKNVPLTWYIVVSSQERNSGALDKVLFQDQLAQAGNIMKLTGAQMNKTHLFDSFERTWNAKGLFERETPAPMGQPGDNSGTPKTAEDMMSALKGMQSSPDQGPGPGQQSPQPAAAGAQNPNQPTPSPMGMQMMPKPGGLRPGAKALTGGK